MFPHRKRNYDAAEYSNPIAVNNPECKLIVLLIDERPEEVTEMVRKVNGEGLAHLMNLQPAMYKLRRWSYLKLLKWSKMEKT